MSAVISMGQDISRLTEGLKSITRHFEELKRENHFSLIELESIKKKKEREMNDLRLRVMGIGEILILIG